MKNKRRICGGAISLLLLLAMFWNAYAAPDAYRENGIYYEPIETTIVGNKAFDTSNSNMVVCYAYTALNYDGKIYTSCASLSSEDEKEIRAALGKELSGVYGNRRIYWSTDAAALFDCTEEKTLYAVQGYDTEDRVGIYYEIETTKPKVYVAVVFERLNGIWLNRGEDLYGDILHLEHAERVYAVDSGGAETAVDEALLEEFLAALYEGKMVSSDDAGYQQACETEGYLLYFEDANGIKTCIAVYPEGYVSYEGAGTAEFVTQVEEEVCGKLLVKFIT